MARFCLKSHRRATCRWILITFVFSFTIPLSITQVYYGAKNFGACCVQENTYCSASGRVNISNSTGNLTIPPGVYSTEGVDMGLAKWLIGDSILGFTQFLILLAAIIAYTQIRKAEKRVLKWKRAMRWLALFILFPRLIFTIIGSMIEKSSTACEYFEPSMYKLTTASLGIDISNLVFSMCLLTSAMATL